SLITSCSTSIFLALFFFFSSRRRHTRSKRDWSSDVCSSDLATMPPKAATLSVSRARETDSVAAFGGIVALNRPIDVATAGAIVRSEERRVGKEGRSRWGP